MAKISDYKAIGVTGLNRQGGYIYEEFLTELSGTRWRKVCREMSENDAMIGAILFAIEMMLRQVDWDVEPYREETYTADGEVEKAIQPDDQERAEFVEECMKDMTDTWEDTVAEILTMLPWGFAAMEQTFKRRADGRIGWASWSIRSQDTVEKWEWDTDGNLTGLWQMAPPDNLRVFIPIEKLLLFRTTSRKGNPEGRSILRSAYRSWYMKKNIENIEGIGIERDLAGLPVAYVPPDILSSTANDDQKALLLSIKNIVTNIRRDEQEGVVWPLAYDENGNKLFDLTLLSTGGTRSFDTDRIISRYDQRIAMTVLADFILLGHEKVGSFSLSSDKTNLFSTALSAWLDSIAETINRFAIPKLFKLNGWPLDRLPCLEHGDIERVSMTELADYVSTLTNSSVIVADDDLERHMRQQADLPQPVMTREEAQAQQPQQPAQPDPNAPPAQQQQQNDAQMAFVHFLDELRAGRALIAQAIDTMQVKHE